MRIDWRSHTWAHDALVSKLMMAGGTTLPTSLFQCWCEKLGTVIYTTLTMHGNDVFSWGTGNSKRDCDPVSHTNARHTYNKIHFTHIVLAILKVTVEPKWSSSVGVAIRLDVWRKPLKSLYFQGRFGRIWERGRDQHLYVFSAPFSRKRCGEISIICLVCFWHAVKL